MPAVFAKHRPRYQPKRQTSSERGYDSKWREARTQFLYDHPYCVDCLVEGSAVAATVVDHVIPHKGDMRLFWDQSNWASRCKRHHDSKTAKLDGGFGNPIRK